MTRRYSDHELFTIYTNPQEDVPEDVTADDMAQYNRMASAMYDQQVEEERRHQAQIIERDGEMVAETDMGEFILELWYRERYDDRVGLMEDWHEIRRDGPVGEEFTDRRYVGALSEEAVRDSWRLDGYARRGLTVALDSDGQWTV